MKLNSILRNKEFYSWIRNKTPEQVDEIRDELNLKEEDFCIKGTQVRTSLNAIKQVFNYYLYNK